MSAPTVWLSGRVRNVEIHGQEVTRVAFGEEKQPPVCPGTNNNNRRIYEVFDNAAWQKAARVYWLDVTVEGLTKLTVGSLEDDSANLLHRCNSVIRFSGEDRGAKRLEVYNRLHSPVVCADGEHFGEVLCGAYLRPVFHHPGELAGHLIVPHN